MFPNPGLRFAPVLAPFVALIAAFSTPPRPSAAKVRLSIATLHAAALTEPRAQTDSVDQPYFLVSIAGPHAAASMLELPARGHLRIHEDEALGARPLADLSLEPGDSVRVLVSVLTGAVHDAEEKAAADASTRALTNTSSPLANQLKIAMSALTAAGGRWLGSSELVIANDDGTVHWRALRCVVSCNVLSGQTTATLDTANAKQQGAVALSGAGASYHMQLRAEVAR
ncbi:MAG TPA: hypothetical protein VN706_12675 [Gemmatimonadaceae bacterium]|nr:hypothetical protein [Gemmatimonadaceae bacterium]